MKERPILFSGAMVNAILEGRKTQTRRVLKLPQWSTKDWNNFEIEDGLPNIICKDTGCFSEIQCPYGKPGDRLYVRETWQPHPEAGMFYPDHSPIPSDAVCYAADLSTSDIAECRPWKPSIHMPRWASRINLEIVKIRAERLQEITHEDAKAEGVTAWHDTHPDHGTVYVPEFKILWNKINTERGFGWDVNPWVWVVEFRRIP